MEHISEREIRIGSLLAALMICSKLLNTAIPVVYSGGIQPGIITMGAIWGLYFLYVFLFKKNKANLFAAGFLIYILVFFAISNAIYTDHIRLLTLHFVEYGVAGFLIAGTKYNVEKITRYTSLILLILIYPIIVLLQTNISVYSDSLGMGISYALLPPAVTAIIHLLYFRKRNDYLMYAAYLFSAYILYQIIVRGIRGSILCILILFFFVILNHERFRSSFNIRRGIILIVVFIGLLNIDYIFSFIANGLGSLGIHIRFIEKTIALGNVVGDVSNGRNNIYSVAIRDFIDSPIWGKGIGYFPELHGMNYPHNIVLQVLGEGGLLLGIPIIGLLIRIVYYLIFGKLSDHNQRAYIILLASITIPAAFVSDELWNYQLLWLLFGVVLKQLIPQEKKAKLLKQRAVEEYSI